MAGFSSNQSSGYSTSTPIQTPQSEWGLQLSQLLSALGQNQYNWALDQYNHGQQVTNANIDNYMRLSGYGTGLAKTLMGRYQNVFAPMMDKYIQQAGSYNSADRQRFNMGAAESTVAQADQAARDAAERNLQSFGINPNSGRYQDLMLTSRIQDAAARAAAGTKASLDTAAAGRQMTRDVAQMGQNVPGMTVNALNSAFQGVTGAENAILGQQNAGATLTSTVPPFMNAASSAIKTPSQATQAKNQSAGASTQTDPAGARGGGMPPTPSPHAADNSGSRQLPSAAPDNSKASGMANIPFMKGGVPGIIPVNSEDDKGNPLYDPAMWDYLDSQGGTMPSWLDPWSQTGTQPATGGPDQQDWSNPTPFTGVTDPTAAPDVGTWTAGQPMGPTPGPQPNPWDGVPTEGQFGEAGGRSLGSMSDFQDQTGALGQDFGQDFTQGFGQEQTQQDYGDQGGFDQGQGDFGRQDQGPQDDFGPQDQGTGGDTQDYGAGDYGGYGGYARGGSVRGMIPGGHVPTSASPSGGKSVDDVPARLNAGEFVIPRDVVQDLGQSHFRKLIKKSRQMRTGMAGPPARPTMKPALRMRPTFSSARV